MESLKGTNKPTRQTRRIKMNQDESFLGTIYEVKEMKFELILIACTSAIVYNLYTEGKYSKLFYHYKKYYQIAMVLFVALSIYVMSKKHPDQSKQMLLHTSQFVQHLPISRQSMPYLSSLFDFTGQGQGQGQGTNQFMGQLNQVRNYINGGAPMVNPSFQRPVKRLVSETKKKYVAMMQDWKCAHCGNKLKHTFEVDHRIRLDQGGTNDVSNLTALCRECHGDKTASENM